MPDEPAHHRREPIRAPRCGQCGPRVPPRGPLLERQLPSVDGRRRGLSLPRARRGDRAREPPADGFRCLGLRDRRAAGRLVGDLRADAASLLPGRRLGALPPRLRARRRRRIVLRLSRRAAAPDRRAAPRERGLERPVYMGCSMGGHLAGDLALHYPEEFRAVIGVEAALASRGTDTLLPWFHHPRLGNDSKPSLMYTLTAPQSPERFRQETIWVYSQGAPAVFKGDLDYYALEHDLTGKAQNIGTKNCAVY